MVKITLLTMVVLLVSRPVLATTQDPTAPLGWSVPSSSANQIRQAPLPQLQSIVCQQQCYAVFNDQLVSVGMTIRGYRVSQITDSEVTLHRGKKSWELQLFSLDIKN